MPKIVDHDVQRRDIATAAVRWIAHHGVETLSQRNVASLAGRSKGNVQHYFPDKASLMFGALRRITEVRVERERAMPDEPFAALRDRLHDVLPIDDRRADEWRARLSLYVHAANDAEMQRYLADHAEEILVRGTAEIALCQQQGLVRRELDARLTFRRLSAAVSGIAVAALATGGALSGAEQKAMLEEVLKSITA